MRKSEESAQPCGCDPNAGWSCWKHNHENFVTPQLQPGVGPSVKHKTDAQLRKEYPLATGCLDYFPLALMEVAHLSFVGSQQHNPGEPMHWDRSKSADEADAIARHLKDRGTLDTDGVRHSTKVAWRALANLQKELEKEQI